MMTEHQNQNSSRGFSNHVSNRRIQGPVNHRRLNLVCYQYSRNHHLSCFQKEKNYHLPSPLRKSSVTDCILNKKIQCSPVCPDELNRGRCSQHLNVLKNLTSYNSLS
ncbi:hypothetical protein V6N12_065555 [Hibiscus sabdariffa]|uniref:Uncharacterized protein n=1 Tax=Hibiscus sabdariffa TaxID=183260 RepID=A0ABR2GA22_9ROSI